MIILIKWSKTLQNCAQVRLIKLPVLNNSLCPVNALKKCLLLSPGSKDSPLFKFKVRSTWVPLTDSKVRQHLKNILKVLHLPKDHLTFHSFRHPGASFAFNPMFLYNISKHRAPGRLTVSGNILQILQTLTLLLPISRFEVDLQF